MASLVPPGESRVSPHLEVPFAMEGDIVTDSGCGQLGVGGHTIPPFPEYRRVDSVSPIGHSSVSPGPVPFNRLESVRKAVQRLRRAWRGDGRAGRGASTAREQEGSPAAARRGDRRWDGPGPDTPHSCQEDPHPAEDFWASQWALLVANWKRGCR